MKEKWIQIEDYPDYSISNYGRAKSFKKDHKHGRIILGSKLQGYLIINATCLFRESKILYIHRLVAKYFLGDADGRLVIHKSDDKFDNCVLNLKYITRSEFTLMTNRNKKKKVPTCFEYTKPYGTIEPGLLTINFSKTHKKTGPFLEVKNFKFNWRDHEEWDDGIDITEGVILREVQLKVAEYGLSWDSDRIGARDV